MHASVRAFLVVLTQGRFYWNSLNPFYYFKKIVCKSLFRVWPWTLKFQAELDARKVVCMITRLWSEFGMMALNDRRSWATHQQRHRVIYCFRVTTTNCPVLMRRRIINNRWPVERTRRAMRPKQIHWSLSICWNPAVIG